MLSEIHTAPPETGTAALGKTLPALLYEAEARYDNPNALNHPSGTGWETWSLRRFRNEAEEVALGLVDLGLERGDRVALFMDNDVHFCLADMGCLIAGLVDVPIYVTHADEQIAYVASHAGARAIIVTDAEQAARMIGLLDRLEGVELLLVAGPGALERPVELPERVQLLHFADVRARGKARLAADPAAITDLLAGIDPHDLATIIYTSGTTGQPKGVMLTHENISHNAVTSFSGIQDLQPGADGEVSLSFLPMTHVFARTLHYGFMQLGGRSYFVSPDDLGSAFQRVRPTIFASVPRVLEKVYSSILQKITELDGPKKRLANWALDLAYRYELGTQPRGLYRLQLALADRLVFSKWRAALGGRVKYVISGGAALSADLANLFAAAGVQVLQGYGLTETSPVITYNRPELNRAGTVGVPIPPVEVTLADDGEILTRGPHIMKGYYRDDERTREVIDDEGWFHTGDVGAFTDEGFLRITDRKKDLFKLSTGKYVTPQPLENKLTTHPLVEQAVVVGDGHKFCAALIFPEPEALRTFARARRLDADQAFEDLVQEPKVVERYERLVKEANAGMDPWSTIKRFRLVPGHLTVDNGLLTPTMKVRRANVRKTFADEIEALYAAPEAAHGPHEGMAV